MSDHPIVHIEISANDYESAGTFYQDVFGWEISPMPEMNYATFMSQKDLGGGFNPVSDQNPAGTVTVYIQADDIEKTLGVIEARGGKTVLPKSEIPGIGWFAFFQDPTGNIMALYKSMPQT